MNRFFYRQKKMGITFLVGLAVSSSFAMASFENVDCLKDIKTLGISTKECEVLEILWESTHGKGWQENQNWDTLTPVNSWDGVSVVDDKVSSLLLYSNNLKGKIPVEIGELSDLKRLSLANNTLSGHTPEALGSLSQLVYLELSNNSLNGMIPSSLGGLLNLKELYLNNNELSGTIPDALGDLESLQVLKLYENKFSGKIPITLGALSNLDSLSLSENELTGAIPSELGELSKLSYLDLKSNQLSGNIPLSLGYLSALTGLYLQENRLTGDIPVQLGTLSNLTDLDLASNQLGGAIPSEFGNLSKLVYLNVANNQLKGNLPSELLSLAILNHLNIEGNRFIFAELEALHFALSYLPTYIISPQLPLDKDSVLETVNLGERLTIVSSLERNPSGNDRYSWYKDGLLIEGETSNIFTKRGVTLEDEGVYTYEVINSLVLELTLPSHHESEGIKVNIFNNLGATLISSDRRAKELNSIVGVNGAVEGIDYSKAIEEAYYVDLNHPTAKELQSVINNVNKSINSKTSIEIMGTSTSITVLNVEEMAFYEITTLKIEGTENFGDSLRIESEGVWSIDDNQIIFTPLASFKGMPIAIFYTIEKVDGTLSNRIKVSMSQKIIEENSSMDINRSVTIDILENEKIDIDLNSIEIMLPEGFMDEHPYSLLSEDKRTLVVEAEGVWSVENSGIVTFTPEEGFVGEPANISYLVLLNSGEKSTVGTIDIKNKKTADSEVEQISSVPTLDTSGLLLMMILSGLFGMFYARKIN